MKLEKNSIPKISIIMTVKDAEKYLKESIDSILKQTLKEIEIVVVDGNSKDKTLKILNGYKNKDNRVVVYEQTRPGIGAAKNCGIEHANGEFVTFLDADDLYIDDDALEKMYDAAKKNEVKVCGAFRNYLINGKIEKANLHRAFLVGFPNGRMFYYENCQYDYHFHSYIYDRKMLIDNKIAFAETSVYDDTHFFIRAMHCAERFYVVPAELYCYRVHSSYSWSADKCYEALNNMIDQLKFTSENKLDIGHYIVIQRINYEYGPLFEKYIKKGDLKLLQLLIEAEQCINQELLTKIINRPIDENIISSMDFPNNKLFVCEIDEKSVVFLTILYKIFEFDNNINVKVDNSYGFSVEDVYNSKTYKVGKVVTIIPRKIFKLFHLK